MRRTFAPIIRAAATLLVLCASLVVASPAQAVSSRDIKAVWTGQCLYREPGHGYRMKNCKTKPARYGNWKIYNGGKYNGHPLWIIRVEGGSCLGVGGDINASYLTSSCNATGLRNVWEVFTTRSGYVLKSFGAYKIWRGHKCVMFYRGTPGIDDCGLTPRLSYFYR